MRKYFLLILLLSGCTSPNRPIEIKCRDESGKVIRYSITSHYTESLDNLLSERYTKPIHLPCTIEWAETN